ncbi:MAG: hypothetical protein DMD61_04980 [Gemmatimonadetes bacterium]|nr:MAG: hypothetical protein DMD61_04980 [Gemmatimonadota bacterium]
MLAVQAIPADSLRRAVAEVFARPAYRWATGRSPLEWVGEQIRRFLDWLGRAEASHPAAFRVLLVLLVVALLAVLAHMGYVVWRITRPTTQTAGRVASAPGLTFEDARAHREHSEQLARAGRYAEALAHRFVAVLLELDRDEALKFHPSKTPAEYVGEARLDEAGRTALGELVARLYDHVFGAAPCDEQTYRAFATRVDLLHEHVASG